VSTATATHRRERIRVAGVVRYVILSVVALPWVVLPLWLLLVNSFKTQGAASVPSLAWPAHLNILQNYAAVINQGAFFTGLANSALMAIPAIFFVLFFGSMAAWSYARSTSRTMKFAYYATSLSMILPAAIIPTVYILINLELNGTRIGYVLTIIGTRLGVVIFLSTGFIATLPASLEEAALIDGASKWQVYWHVILPMLRPVLFTAAILLVISVWNDFFYALFLLPGQSQATLPLNLYRFATTSTTGVAWNLVFADVVLTGLPLLIVYLVLQKRVLGGLTEGSVTG
jgi:raffinose/stachyose/melibiose transport system permease protein